METPAPPAASATPPPATPPSPDAAAAGAAAAGGAAAAAAEGSVAVDGGLVLDAAIYEPSAERLRNYQQTALNKARQGNLVMCGASGIGKTHVALSLLREADYTEGKLAFFLTTTRDLAEQQCNRVKRATSLSAKLCVGIELDLWSKEKWQALFQRHSVIVCTAQVLVNLLDKGSEYMTMARINILILDECHRAHRNHPYTKVMAHYDRADPATRPRVFGMTATPSKSCAAILHSPVHVCPLDDVKVFAAKAPLRVVQYDVEERAALQAGGGDGGQDQLLLLGAGGGGVDLLEGMVGELHSRLPSVAKAGNLDAEALRTSHDHMGAWFGLRHVQLVLEHWGNSTPFYDSEKDAEEGALAGKLAFYLSKALREAVARGNVRCSDHVQKLLVCLAERRAHDGPADFRAIVFVQRRLTCRVLYEYLSLLPGFQGATGFAIGQATASGVSAYGLTRRQRRPVQDFGAGRVQVLVATDVLSEGIDVPECSLVVAFDEVPNPTAFVQMRGRARQHDGGAFVLFAADADTLHKIFHMEVAASRFEQELLAEEHALLHPGDHSMSRLFPEYSHLVPSTGALINLDNAMPFLNQVCVWNRECQSYGLSPVAEMYEESCPTTGEPHFRCLLSLPAVFGIPPQASGAFRSKRVARAVAAFLACREFHRRGVVDDDLNPVRESVQLTSYDHFIPEFAGLQATNEHVPLRLQPDLHLGLARLTREPPPPPPPQETTMTTTTTGAAAGEEEQEAAMAVVVTAAAAAEEMQPATTTTTAPAADAAAGADGVAPEESVPTVRTPPPGPPLEMVLEPEATREAFIYLLGESDSASGNDGKDGNDGNDGNDCQGDGEQGGPAVVDAQQSAPHQQRANVLGVLTTVAVAPDALAMEGLPTRPARTERLTGAQLELLARFHAILLHFVLHGPAAFQTELAEFLKVKRAPRAPADDKPAEGQETTGTAGATAAEATAMEEEGQGEGEATQKNPPATAITSSSKADEADGAATAASEPNAAEAAAAADGDAMQQQEAGEEGAKEEKKGENGEAAAAGAKAGGKRKKRRKGKLALDEEQVEVFFHGAIEPHAGYDKGYLLVPLDPATGAVDWPRVRALVEAPAPRHVAVGGGSLWPLPGEEALMEGLVLTQASETSACRLWAVEAVTEATLGQAREAAAAAAAARAAAREAREKEKEEERAEQEAREAEARGDGDKEAMAVVAAAEPGGDGDAPAADDSSAARDLKRRLQASSPAPAQQKGSERKRARASVGADGGDGDAMAVVEGDKKEGVAEGDGAGEAQAEEKKKKAPEEPRIFLIEYAREVWDACEQEQQLLLVEKVLDSPHCFRKGAGGGLAVGAAAEEDFRVKRQRSSNRRLIAPQVAALVPLPKHIYLACQRLLPRVWRLEIALAVQRVVERIGVPLRNKALVRAALCKPDYERLETIGDTYLKLVMGGVVLRKEPYLVRESLMHEFRANLICNRRLMQAARSRALDGSIVLRKKVMNEPFRYWAPSLTRPGAASASVVQAKVVADVVEALTGAYLVGEGPAAADAFLHWLGLPVLCGPQCRALSGAEPSPVAATAQAVLAAPLPNPRAGARGRRGKAAAGAEGPGDGDEKDGNPAPDGESADEAQQVAHPTPEEGADEEEAPTILQPARSAARSDEIHWPLHPKTCHCWTRAALAHAPQTVFPKALPAPAPDLVEKIGKLERLLRYTFCNKWLAFQALTHPSHTHKSRRSALGGGHTVLVSDYQRFEFLGDALLDYMVVVQVAFEHPEWPPQRLHNAKQVVVTNEHLAQCALHWLQLHRFFESDSIELNHCVERFAQRGLSGGFGGPAGAGSGGGNGQGEDAAEEEDEEEDEEEETDVKKRDSGPKALADVLEALIAAVYLDCHGDVTRLAQVFLPFLRPRAPRHRTGGPGGPGGPGGGGGGGALAAMGALGGRQWKQRNRLAEGLTVEDEGQLHALFPSISRMLSGELGLGRLDPELLKAPVVPAMADKAEGASLFAKEAKGKKGKGKDEEEDDGQEDGEDNSEQEGVVMEVA